jgi:UDP-glucose 4-epimerase
MTRVWITGIAGFLGSHVADRMLALGHTVSGNDNMIGGDIDNVTFGTNGCAAVDCCDEDGIASLFKAFRPDVVVHCAATAHEGLSVFSPAFITRNIYGATVSTVSAAIQAGVKRFVMCSSMARYGKGFPPFREDQRLRPVDPYGIAKVAAEHTLKVLARVHEMEWNIAVPHNIFGPRQKYDDPFRNVVSIMINRALQGKAPIVYGLGFQKRSFSWIGDCVDALCELALGPIHGEIVNIGPDERGVITINQLAAMIMEATGFYGSAIHIPERPCEVPEAYCSSDKAWCLFRFDPTTDMREAIRLTVEHIRERGPKPFDYSTLPIEIVSDLTPKTWTERLM